MRQEILYPTIENCYVAVLDILGYKNTVKKFFNELSDQKLNNPHLIQKIYSALQHAGVETEGQDSPDRIQTRIFSDTIFLSIPCKINGALLRLMHYASLLSVWFFENDLLLRGGIAKGTQVQLKDGNISILASEGVIKAHKIESETAVYPTIILDEELNEYVCGSLEKYVFVYKDCYHLNFFRYAFPLEGLKNISPANEKVASYYLEKVMGRISEISEQIETINGKEKLEQLNRIKDKYEWLISYLIWCINYARKNTGMYATVNVDAYQKKLSHDYSAYFQRGML